MNDFLRMFKNRVFICNDFLHDENYHECLTFRVFFFFIGHHGMDKIFIFRSFFSWANLFS